MPTEAAEFSSVQYSNIRIRAVLESPRNSVSSTYCWPASSVSTRTVAPYWAASIVFWFLS